MNDWNLKMISREFVLRFPLSVFGCVYVWSCGVRFLRHIARYSHFKGFDRTFESQRFVNDVGFLNRYTREVYSIIYDMYDMIS